MAVALQHGQRVDLPSPFLYCYEVNIKVQLKPGVQASTQVEPPGSTRIVLGRKDGEASAPTPVQVAPIAQAMFVNCEVGTTTPYAVETPSFTPDPPKSRFDLEYAKEVHPIYQMESRNDGDDGFNFAMPASFTVVGVTQPYVIYFLVTALPGRLLDDVAAIQLRVHRVVTGENDGLAGMETAGLKRMDYDFCTMSFPGELFAKSGTAALAAVYSTPNPARPDTVFFGRELHVHAIGVGHQYTTATSVTQQILRNACAQDYARSIEGNIANWVQEVTTPTEFYKKMPAADKEAGYAARKARRLNANPNFGIAWERASGLDLDLSCLAFGAGGKFLGACTGETLTWGGILHSNDALQGQSRFRYEFSAGNGNDEQIDVNLTSDALAECLYLVFVVTAKRGCITDAAKLVACLSEGMPDENEYIRLKQDFSAIKCQPNMSGIVLCHFTHHFDQDWTRSGWEFHPMKSYFQGNSYVYALPAIFSDLNIAGYSLAGPVNPTLGSLAALVPQGARPEDVGKPLVVCTGAGPAPQGLVDPPRPDRGPGPEKFDASARLFVLIHGANGLLGADDNDTISDPYVTVALGKRQAGKTAVIKKTLNPFWEQLITIPGPFRHDDDALVLSVFDKDMIGSDFLGRVEIPEIIRKVFEPTTFILPLTGTSTKNRPAEGQLWVTLAWDLADLRGYLGAAGAGAGAGASNVL